MYSDNRSLLSRQVLNLFANKQPVFNILVFQMSKGGVRIHEWQLMYF